METGDIANFYFDKTQGNEVEFNRPAVILKVLEKSGMAIVIPLTTNLKTEKYEYTWPLKSDEFNKLEKPSIALIFQLRAITLRRITNSVFGKLNSEDLTSIKSVLKDMLAL